jgi:hypothetical protein
MRKKDEVEIGVLDVDWVQRFRDKLAENRSLFGYLEELFDMTAGIASFLKRLHDEPKLRWDSTALIALVVSVNVPTGATRTNEKTGEHEEEIRSDVLTLKKLQVPLGVIVRASTSIAVYLLDFCKTVEEDSAKLQDVLGAVSELRELASLRLQMDANGPRLVNDEPKSN